MTDAGAFLIGGVLVALWLVALALVEAAARWVERRRRARRLAEELRLTTSRRDGFWR